MGDGVVALILLIAFIASAFLLARRRSVLIDPIERDLPAELHGAEVAFAERTFRSHRHRLVARLDRAYRTPMGIQLVELKTRAHDVVYMSDVIELSVQRITIEDETGETVSDDAWVIVQNGRTGTRRPRKVHLMKSSDITAMRKRYADVVQGRVGRPDPARSPSQCSQCAHQAKCAARYQDRGRAARLDRAGTNPQGALAPRQAAGRPMERPSLTFVELPGLTVLGRKVAHPGRARGRIRRFDSLGKCVDANDFSVACSGCPVSVKAVVRGADWVQSLRFSERMSVGS